VSESPIRVLALDLSSKCVGYAVFEGTDLVDHGKYVTEGVSHDERLLRFQLWLMQLFDAVHPEELVVERAFSGRQRNAYGVLMLYHGALMASWFAFRGEPLPDECRIMAKSVKRLLGFKQLTSHDARKKQAVQAINKLYRLRLKYKSHDPFKKVSEDDVADAIAAGRAYLIQQGRLYAPLPEDKKK
jgi:Holliday junction resolvasome RuvABC endonuclease subunit